MNNKTNFLLSLQEIKNNFNSDDLNDYKEFIGLLNLILSQNETDEDILNEISILINEITFKPSKQEMHNRELKKLNRPVDLLMSSYFKTPFHEKGRNFV